MTARLSQKNPWSLPERVVTKGGVIFDPRPDRWCYDDHNIRVSVNFELCPPTTAPFRFAVKKIMIAYAETRAPDTVRTTWNRLLSFVRVVAGWRNGPLDELSEVDMMNFKAYRNVNGRPGEYLLSQLKGCLRLWHTLQLPGISDGAAEVLEGLRLKGPPQGDAVLTRDPIKGPLTDIELQGFIQAVDNSFANGEVDEAYYLATWLFSAIGLRSIQLAALKVCDMSLGHDVQGAPVYLLNIPRAKQRDALTRELFKERKLIHELGAPLYDYAQRVRASFEGRLPDAELAPLFPHPQGGTTRSGDEFCFHHMPHQLRAQLRRVWAKFGVISERTGRPLKLSTRRLRYTFGTRAAQENCTLVQIAEMLDHSDMQSAEVYIASTAEIAIRIDSKVAKDLAPLAQAFTGRLIRDESEASRSHEPASRIIDMRVDQCSPIGSCGTRAECALLKPIACYTCSNFEPWLDGPHEKLLQRLLSERKRLLADTDERIASINDRTILAVEYVIQVCCKERDRRALRNG